MREVSKRERQRAILEIVSDEQIATQEDLSRELAIRGLGTTQSSVSRDISQLGLVKVDGFYSAPAQRIQVGGPITRIDTAGDNIIVIKTAAGQAQPIAVILDRAIDASRLHEVVGTVAGDDTVFVAVRNSSAQRLAMKRIVELCLPAQPTGAPAGTASPGRPVRNRATTSSL